MRSLSIVIFFAASAVAAAQSPTVPSPANAPAPKMPAEIAAVLKLAWSEPFDASAVRIAVADITGDGQDRVVAVGPLTDERSVISAYRWDGAAFALEWQRAIDDNYRLVAAGRFVRDAKDAQIVTAGGWWRTASGALVHTPFKGVHPPVGVLTRSTGGDVLLTMEPEGVRMWTIDPDQGGLVPYDEAPAASWASGLLRSRDDALARFAPKEYASAGLLAFWIDAATSRRRTALACAGSNAAATALVTADKVAPTGVTVLGRSPALGGSVLDFAMGDPKGVRTSFIVALAATDAAGAGRALVAFPLADIPSATAIREDPGRPPPNIRPVARATGTPASRARATGRSVGHARTGSRVGGSGLVGGGKRR